MDFDSELGKELRDEGMARVLANAREAWKKAVKIVAYNFPSGWIGQWEEVVFIAKEGGTGKPHHSNAWSSMSKEVIRLGWFEHLDGLVHMTIPSSHGRITRLLRRTDYRRDPTMAVFNLAERIQQVRDMEALIKAKETALEEELKPRKEWADMARTQILKYLNDTGQKSAATVNGTAYWKEKVTFRVQDKDEFRRHVIGSEQWELITWAAAGVACETFAQAHEGPPPGLFRNAVNILYINAPPKPRKKAEGNGAELPMTAEEKEAEQEAWAKVEREERENM